MKKNQIIQNLIAEGESEQLEYKSNVLKDSIAKTICSFLNSKGGTVLIGIDDKKNIVGVKNADKHKTDLEYYLVATIVPEAPVTVSIEKINGKKLLLVKVWGGSKQPYIFDGSIYYRIGTVTQKATSKEISDLIHNRSISEKNWERQVFTEVSLEDLDIKLITDTIRESQKNNKTNYTGEDILKFLTHYGLYENGAFTKACVVLFAKNPVRFLPQIRVRLTEYPESKTDKALIRDKYFEGNLFKIREDIEKYINGLGTRSVFDKNQWKRIDFSFPKKALQEGVINALIHRDYSSSRSGVAISVYPDTFVISNSGKFPDDIQIKDLKRNHRSHPVNPDIAHIVYLRGFIDKLGRGTIKLVEECRSAGLKEPVWKETSEGVTLTFHGPKALAEKKQQNDAVNDAVSDAVNDAVNDAVSDAVNDAVNDAVKIRLCKELVTIYVKNGIGLKELMNRFNMSRATLQRDIAVLKEHNLIVFAGSAKTGVYKLTEKLKIKLDSIPVK